MAAQLLAAGQQLVTEYPVPGSSLGVDAVGQDVLFKIESWQKEEQVDYILLFHAKPMSGTAFQPWRTDLLPLDRSWLEQLRANGILQADAASQRIVQALGDVADVLTPEQRIELMELRRLHGH